VNAVFDTLAYAKKLQAAGLAEGIAAVHAEALAGVVEKSLATRGDIKRLKNSMAADRFAIKSDITRLENSITDVRKDMFLLEDRLSYKIEKVTYQLTIRLGSLLTAGILLIGALHKLFN
jgi:hypothetical protein